jgi:MFS transporter, DHA3 family, macrolide efflux protein
MTDEHERWSETNWKKRFFTIWTGQAFSLFGSSLVGFALIWWLTQTTGSATVLATASLVGMVPQLVLMPLAGVVVDRYDRRLLMMASDTGIAVLTAVLACLFLFGVAQLWHVYVALFFRSALGAFQWPAMQSSTSLMVPEKQLARVAGANQTLQGAMSIVAPMLGALLLSVLPIGGILLIDVVTAMMAVLPLIFIRVPQPKRESAPAYTTSGVAQRAPSMWHDMREGLRYVVAWRGLFLLILGASLINFLFNPAFTLLPILVTKIFNGGALELGWVNSAWGFGVVAGGLTLGVWGGFKKRILTTIMGVLGMGVGTLIMGLSPAPLFVLALFGMLLAGFMNPIANGPLMAIFQANVAPQMQGRVISLISMVAGAMSPLSLLIAGPVSDLLGVRVWYMVAGVGVIAIAVVMLTVPAIMNMEQERSKHALDQSTASVLVPALDVEQGAIS